MERHFPSNISKISHYTLFRPVHNGAPGSPRWSCPKHRRAVAKRPLLARFGCQGYP
jgi:hypothetical protein